MGDESCFNCHELLSKCDCGNTQSFSDEAPVCPYCGFKEERSSLDYDAFTDGVKNWECSNCEERYTLDVFVVHSWTGSRKD